MFARILKIRYLAVLAVIGILSTGAYAFTNSFVTTNNSSADNTHFFAAESDTPVQGCTASHVTWASTTDDPEHVHTLSFTLDDRCAAITFNGAANLEVEFCTTADPNSTTTPKSGCTTGTESTVVGHVPGTCTAGTPVVCTPNSPVTVESWTGFELAATNFGAP